MLEFLSKTKIKVQLMACKLMVSYFSAPQKTSNITREQPVSILGRLKNNKVTSRWYYAAQLTRLQTQAITHEHGAK